MSVYDIMAAKMLGKELQSITIKFVYEVNNYGYCTNR